MQDDFDRFYWGDKKINDILDKMFAKKANYKDVDDYAVQIGELRERVIISNMKDVDPKYYNDIGAQIIKPQLQKNYDLVVLAAQKTQEALNKKANLGLKAVTPKFNEDKASGLIKKFSAAKNYEELNIAVNENITTFTKGIVSDSIYENASFQYKAGLRPVIKRIPYSGCCKWCTDLGGVYNYADVMNSGNSVYRFHARCRCYIIYDPQDGSRRVDLRTGRGDVSIESEEKRKEAIRRYEQIRKG